jgi:hypothetical protein
MEQFGARTEGPLETCLAEVEQSDIYIGIIAFRLGSVDPESRKSFTQLEYQHAVETGKEVLIYLADEEEARFPFVHIDDDAKNRRRLAVFKERLRERHTVNTFTTPDDLAEKLDRDFARYFSPKKSEPERDSIAEEFEKSVRILGEFRLTPRRYNGQEVRLAVSFTSTLFPASRDLCHQFNLEYGDTVGVYIRISKPDDQFATQGFRELYATGGRVTALRKLYAEKQAELFALLQFSEKDVSTNTAKFFGQHYYPGEDVEPDDETVYIPPEGKVILVLSNRA